MSDQTATYWRRHEIQARTRQAAWAAERLAEVLAKNTVEDPIAMAYVHRLLHATMNVENHTRRDRMTVEPDPAYLAPLGHRP